MNRAKREYYLTDLVAISIQRGFKTAAYCIGTEEEYMGVNTNEELYKANRFMTKKIIRRWIRHGVKFINADSVFIHSNVGIGKDTIIYPNVYIEGKSKVGRESVIYPNVRIINSSIGNQVIIKDATLIESSRIKDRASIGPFAHIRPGSVVETDAKIGNFVELKKAFIGKRTKASHLAYLGDAKIGRGVNIGAGTITCNFDGEKKHLTVIGDGVFVGSDTQLVAPVKIGKSAYIGAGSTITKDVPAWALSLSRAEQKQFLNWARKKSKVKNKK